MAQSSTASEFHDTAGHPAGEFAGAGNPISFQVSSPPRRCNANAWPTTRVPRCRSRKSTS